MLHKANKEFMDINLKELSSKIQYDYGLGSLTVNRLIENMIELKIVSVKDGIIQTTLDKVPEKGSNEPQDEAVLKGDAA